MRIRGGRSSRRSKVSARTALRITLRPFFGSLTRVRRWKSRGSAYSTRPNCSPPAPITHTVHTVPDGAAKRSTSSFSSKRHGLARWKAAVARKRFATTAPPSPHPFHVSACDRPSGRSCRVPATCAIRPAAARSSSRSGAAATCGAPGSATPRRAAATAAYRTSRRDGVAPTRSDAVRIASASRSATAAGSAAELEIASKYSTNPPPTTNNATGRAAASSPTSIGRGTRSASQAASGGGTTAAPIGPAGSPSSGARRSVEDARSFAQQQRLYLRPEPHGHGSLRPGGIGEGWPSPGGAASGGG